MRVLVIAEHDNASLKPSTLNTISAAKKLTDDVDLIICGFECDSVATEAAGIDALKNVHICNSEHLKYQLSEDVTQIVVSNAKNYSHLLAPATTFGKNLMPRISALLDAQQISDIIEVIDECTFKRPIYAGSCIATVKSLSLIHI